MGDVAYQLGLPPTLTSAHDVFHVFFLKYIIDASHKMDYKNLEIQDDMFYTKKPFKILDTKVNVVRTKTITMVNVLWRNHTIEEATWGIESNVKNKYLELFHE